MEEEEIDEIGWDEVNDELEEIEGKEDDEEDDKPALEGPIRGGNADIEVDKVGCERLLSSISEIPWRIDSSRILLSAIIVLRIEKNSMTYHIIFINN